MLTKPVDLSMLAHHHFTVSGWDVSRKRECKNNESLGSIDHKNVNARKNNATSLEPNLNAVAPTNANQQKLTNEQPALTSS